ncbi:BhlA/UviB family holin-like peptide [Neobacillus vireti]|uniref:Holin-like protein n=1 Tax=Neobacillus vireti LMG 21834 TaxID=1131730 RepID=A0AB94IM41_9BACI|nr:BhlA/UviB family holin-like peptide [Neobacillus vireti]ETI68126.1 holin-like protein [Neobacillus vireti LMG 21834]KLT15915.1 holin [Neobacillus vireti]
MDISSIPIEMWLSQGVFCVLFVWLLIDTRKESKQREERLAAQIEKQNFAQEKIVQSLERLEMQIANIKTQ